MQHMFHRLIMNWYGLIFNSYPKRNLYYCIIKKREGNSTLIDEIKDQMGDKIPDCIIASVGGGGLMIGLIEGLIKNGWMEKEIKLIAVESRGADCFSESIKQQKLITLDSIQSVCKSLGAKTCSKKLFEYYNQYKNKIESVVLEGITNIKCDTF